MKALYEHVMSQYFSNGGFKWSKNTNEIVNRMLKIMVYMATF